MFITYYYPSQEDYEGDWDWNASLEKLETLVRAAVERSLPASGAVFAAKFGVGGCRIQRFYVESYSFSYDVGLIIAGHLSSLAEAIENQSDKWLVPALKPCPFCGSEGTLEVTGSDCSWWVVCACPGCAATGPERNTPELAVEEWNQRA